MTDKRTNAKCSIGIKLDVIKSRNIIDIDELLWKSETQLQHRNQRLTSGKNFCVSTGGI